MSGENVSRKLLNAAVRDNQHFKRVATSVQTFNETKAFADLCFVCARGHRVFAHKLLFCTVSSLLKDMFLEIQDYLQIIYVHVPDVEASMMELLLDFIYEGSVRINKHDYKDFQATMDTLGIVLSPPNSKQSGVTQQPVTQPAPQLQQQIAAPQMSGSQLVYMPATPNAQGQVQYVLAAPSQMNQGQVLQAPLLSPVMSQQPNGQMMQNGTQVMNQQVQQGNVLQMVQQNNTQVVPMNNQVVQCSSQMVLQGNQQGLMTKNHLQVGMQTQVAQSNYATNQPVQQQQPQYVMASNNNQLTTNRATTEYHQPRPQAQGVVRSRGPLPSTQMQQPARMSNSEIDGGLASLQQSIVSILQENSDDPEFLTTRKVRMYLEKKLNRDLADKEDQIGAALKSIEAEEEEEHIVQKCVNVSASSVNSNKASKEPLPRPILKRKTKIPFCQSDDEEDEDFIPKQAAKKNVGKPRRRKKRSN